jgi:hypothetical protein
MLRPVASPFHFRVGLQWETVRLPSVAVRVKALSSFKLGGDVKNSIIGAGEQIQKSVYTFSNLSRSEKLDCMVTLANLLFAKHMALSVEPKPGILKDGVQHRDVVASLDARHEATARNTRMPRIATDSDSDSDSNAFRLRLRLRLNLAYCNRRTDR